MASSAEFMEYVSGQIGGAGGNNYKKKFGGKGGFCKGKKVALVGGKPFFL